MLKFASVMIQSEKPTIMDIARLSGLSKGTVDRVLHNRGEVSRKSYDKVMSVIKELGYEPNVIASALARGVSRRIALLIPEQTPGSFWELAGGGIAKASESVAPLGVSTVVFNYDQRDAESFRDACSRLLDAAPSGVVVAPIFGADTQMFTAELREHSIPYAFFDTKQDDEGYLAYFGLPEYKSGYLCADQLTLDRSASEVLLVRIKRDPLRQSDPTVIRRAGFMDYMSEHCPDCIVRTLFIDPGDPERTDQELDAFFAAFPGTTHVAMFNSRIHLIVPWLERHPAQTRRVVGFDNLKANMEALARGTVSVLIAQHPEEQVAMAIQALTDMIVMGRQPARRDNYMHMDILTRYNVEFY